MNALLHRIVLLCVGALLAAQAGAAPLRIGTWNEQTDALTMGGQAILARAYAELKQPVEFIDLPIRRAMRMMVLGEIDGNVFRVGELAGQQPTLVRVDTPVNATEVRVYARRGAVNPLNWKQLRGLRVAYRRGVLVLERGIPLDARRIEGNSDSDILRMLGANMVDVVLIAEPIQSAPNPQAAANHAERLDTVLETVQLYHYLVGRHRELAERLNAVLKRMQDSGEMSELRQQALARQRDMAASLPPADKPLR